MRMHQIKEAAEAQNLGQAEHLHIFLMLLIKKLKTLQLDTQCDSTFRMDSVNEQMKFILCFWDGVVWVFAA